MIVMCHCDIETPARGPDTNTIIIIIIITTTIIIITLSSSSGHKHQMSNPCIHVPFICFAVAYKLLQQQSSPCISGNTCTMVA